jgi:hypothetical protein
MTSRKSAQHKSRSLQGSDPQMNNKIKSSSYNNEPKRVLGKGVPSLRLYDLLRYKCNRRIQIEFGPSRPKPTKFSRPQQSVRLRLKKLSGNQLLELTRSRISKGRGSSSRGIEEKIRPQSVRLPPLLPSRLRVVVPDLKGAAEEQRRRRRRAAQL